MWGAVFTSIVLVLEHPIFYSGESSPLESSATPHFESCVVFSDVDRSASRLDSSECLEI